MGTLYEKGVHKNMTDQQTKSAYFILAKIRVNKRLYI